MNEKEFKKFYNHLFFLLVFAIMSAFLGMGIAFLMIIVNYNVIFSMFIGMAESSVMGMLLIYYYWHNNGDKK